MLDAVIHFMPSPLDVPAITGILDDKDETPADRKSSDDEPFSSLAFKIATDPFVGSLTFFRVYSGVLKAGDTVQLIGPNYDINELSADAGTIPYEILTSLGHRYQRQYFGIYK